MKKDNKNIIIGVLLIIIITLLILVGYLFFNKEDKEEDKPIKEEKVEIERIDLNETNKEVLIPAIKDVIMDVDIQQKIISVKLLEGLVSDED